MSKTPSLDVTPADPMNDPAALVSIIEQIFDSVLITTTDLEMPGPAIVYANPAFCTKTGYSAAELIGQTPRILQGPGTDRAVLDRLKANLLNGEFFEDSTVNYRKNGEPYMVRWNIRSYFSEPQNRSYYISVQREVTDEVALEQTHQRVVESVVEGIVAVDPSGHVTLVNPAGQTILAKPDQAEWIGEDWQVLFEALSNDDATDLVQPITRVLQTGTTLIRHRSQIERPDGSFLDIEMSVTPLQLSPDSDLGCVIILRDNTDQRRFEKRLWNAANRDALTQAYSRRFGDEIIAREIQRAEADQTPLAIVYFDIDDFKAMNDTHGHDAGDYVLKTLVATVTNRLRQTDYLVRWGGEEFVVILPATTGEMAMTVAEAIRLKVASTELDHGLGHVEISAGVAQYQLHEGFRAWFRRADEALYAAKGAGRNQVHSA